MDKTIKISIILPVYNSKQYLEQALNSIKKSSFKDYELIIVDDASIDSTVDIAKKYNPDVLLINKRTRGPAYSRNKAAQIAKGDILYFTDHDVIIQKNTLQKVHDHFQDKNTNCVIGLYSLPSKNWNICTVYKTAWIRFSYFNSPKNVNWFFTAVGAVRKNIWQKSPDFEYHPIKIDGSDISYGYDLYLDGINILLDKTLEVKHIKKYSLKFLLKNDFNRAFGYTCISQKSFRIFGNLPQKGFANVSPGFISGTILSALSFLALTSSLISPRFSLSIPFFFILYFILNIKFYLYLTKYFSFKTAFSSIGIMFIDHLTCFIGVISAVAYSLFSLFSLLKKKKPI